MRLGEVPLFIGSTGGEWSGRRTRRIFRVFISASDTCFIPNSGMRWRRFRDSGGKFVFHFGRRREMTGSETGRFTAVDIGMPPPMPRRPLE